MHSLRTRIRKILSLLYRYMRQYDVRLNVNRELPYLTILSLLYTSAKIPVYKLFSDDILNIFSGLKYVKHIFAKALNLNLSLETLTSIVSNTIKSKVLARFLTSYEFLTRIDPASTDFIERHMEEILQVIENRWKKYGENTLVFVELTTTITVFLTILTVSFSLLSTISNTSYTPLILILAPILTLMTLISVMILDSYCPIKTINYSNLLTVVFYVLAIIAVLNITNTQLEVITLIPLLLIFILLTLNNARYFVKQIPNILSSLELVIDHIFTHLRLGIPVAIALDNTLRSDIINNDVKQLVIAIKTTRISQTISKLLRDVRISALISLILGALRIGHVDYSRVLRVKKLLNNVFAFEKTFRKQTVFVSVMTIILPPIMLIILYMFTLNIASLANTNTPILNQHGYQDIIQIKEGMLSLLRDLTASMVIVALSLNTIISKAVDYTITSIWRTSLSIMLVLVMFIVLSLI